FVPLGALLAQQERKGWQGQGAWKRVLLLGLAATSFMEFLKLFVISRYFDTANILVGTAAVLAGWFLIAAHQENSFAFAGLKQHRGGRLSSFRWLCLLIWLAIAVYVNWHPFDFTLKPHFVAKRLAQVDLIPFADYQVSDYWNALDQFLTKST